MKSTSATISPNAPELSPSDRALDAWNRGYGLGLRPDPLLTVSEWADRNRYLSQKAASEPGRWRTSRTPYLREVMDCLSPTDPAQRIVFMKGAQIGATEAGNNWIGYVIDQAPGPMLSVQPTTETAKRNSKQRIGPLIEESPSLRGKVRDPRSRDSGNTVLSKEFPGGVLVMVGANSAVGLRSMPARYLFLDEVDGYPGDLDGEGDPIALAEARTRTFARRKVFMVSTPTIAGSSRIEREYGRSDKRRYFVPCPHCGEYQTLEFKQLQWPKGEPYKAEYFCVACGVACGDAHKTEMLARGKWRATDPGEGKAAGFHLSSLYSPVGWLSWVEIAQRWEAAQGDPALLKEFINTVLGETWQERGEAPDWQRLYDRREDYDAVPWGAAFLTAGADVQKDRIEVSVWAWGRGKESWLVEHRVLYGPTNEAAVWTQLQVMLGERWVHESGVQMSIAKLGVDSGAFTAEVYAWVRTQNRAQVHAVDGRDSLREPVGAPAKRDVTAAGKKLRRGLEVVPVGVSFLKGELIGFLNLDRPTEEAATAGASYPPGYVHLGRRVASEDFIKQLTAEQLMTKKIGGRIRREWTVIEGRRNEALDCRNYARAMASLVGLDRWRENNWRAAEERFGLKRPQPGLSEIVSTAGLSSPVPPTPPAAVIAARPARRVRSKGISL